MRTENEKHFYEVGEDGIVNQLSRFACGHAPTGGLCVYAESTWAAQRLAFRYGNGERWLMRDLYVSGEIYPYKDVIHE